MLYRLFEALVTQPSVEVEEVYHIFFSFRGCVPGPRRFAGFKTKLYLGFVRLKTDGQYSKALRIPVNGALNALYSPRF